MVNIDKENFIEVCNNSLTMSEACRKLKLHYNTFKKYAIEFGCYKPNRGGKGQKGKSSSKKIKTEDILEGKYPDYQTFKLKKSIITRKL